MAQQKQASETGKTFAWPIVCSSSPVKRVACKQGQEHPSTQTLEAFAQLTQDYEAGALGNTQLNNRSERYHQPDPTGSSKQGNAQHEAPSRQRSADHRSERSPQPDQQDPASSCSSPRKEYARALDTEPGGQCTARPRL